MDLLYASRDIARRLLSTAVEDRTIFGDLRVLSVEGLVGFKLQALANDPNRPRDLDDIRALMRENQDSIDMVEIREYFKLFHQESLLDRILREMQ